MAEGAGKPPVLQMPEMLITGSPPGDDLPELAREARGPDVTKLQRALTEAGFGVPAIGKFGPKTEAAVLAFQKAHELEETGVVDSDTWQALRGAAPRAFVAPPMRGEYPIHYTPDGTPKLVQSDSRWGTQPLGNSTKGVGEVGCLLTSIAMILSQKLGRLVTPDELNRVLQQNGAFQKKDETLKQSGAIMLVEVASKAIEAEYGVKLPMHQSKNGLTGGEVARHVDSELAAKHPVMLHVDTDGDGTLNHFVVVNRKEGADYIVLDPAMGREYRYQLDEQGQFVARDTYYPHTDAKTKERSYNAPVANGYVPTESPPPPPPPRRGRPSSRSPGLPSEVPK